MKKEREQAEAEAARLRAALNAEANKNKIPLIDRIAMENHQQAERSDPPATLLPVSFLNIRKMYLFLFQTVRHYHNSQAIYDNYKNLGPILVRAMAESKIRAQQKRDDYLANYEEKYLSWFRRVEKFEKTPKKM